MNGEFGMRNAEFLDLGFGIHSIWDLGLRISYLRKILQGRRLREEGGRLKLEYDPFNNPKSAIINPQFLIGFPGDFHQILPVIVFHIFGGQIFKLFTVNIAQAECDLLQACHF